MIAKLNHPRAERVISSHQLEGVRVPQVLRYGEIDPWIMRELGVICSRALDEYEREQVHGESFKSGGADGTRIGTGFDGSVSY